MKTLKITALLIAFTLGGTLMAQDKMANNIDNSNIALQGYSPVSYLDLGLAQRGNTQYKSEFKKVVYYFTSAVYLQFCILSILQFNYNYKKFVKNVHKSSSLKGRILLAFDLFI